MTHPTPRLKLYTSRFGPLAPTYQRLLPEPDLQHRSSSRLIGHDTLLYSAQVDPLRGLDLLHNTLGLEIREDIPGGMVGFVSAVRLNYAGIVTEMSYDNLATSVRARFRELVENGDFEDTSALTGWIIAGATINTTTVAHGAQSCRINRTSPSNGYALQDVVVQPGETYRLSLMVYKPTGTTPIYGIDDQTNLVAIIGWAAYPPTGTNYWQRFEIDFATPATCQLVRIKFGCNTNGDIYFIDDVSVMRRDRDKTVESVTEWQQNNTLEYGIIESEINAQDSSATDATTQATNAVATQSVPTPTDPIVATSPYSLDNAEIEIVVSGYGHTQAWAIDEIGTARQNLALNTLIANLDAELPHITLRSDGHLTGTVKADPEPINRTVAETLATLLPATTHLRNTAPTTLTAENDQSLTIYRKQDPATRLAGYYYDKSARTPVNPWTLPPSFYLVDIDILNAATYTNNMHITEHRATSEPAGLEILQAK